MCRHLGYLGPAASLASLLIDPPHSLLHQSWDSRENRGCGPMNADGFGAGWFPAGRAEPVRYRRDRPLWTDAGFAELAGTVSSTAVLAAVRSATVGMPVMEPASAPFTGDGWLFSLNGKVGGWPDSLAGLAEAVPVTDLLTMEAPTDAAALWVLLRHELRMGVDPVKAVADLVLRVAEAGPDSRLNLLLTDGRTLVGTAWFHSLHVRRGADSVVVASEPFDDDPAWQPVPDRHLVVATAHDGVDMQALDRDGPVEGGGGR